MQTSKAISFHFYLGLCLMAIHFRFSKAIVWISDCFKEGFLTRMVGLMFHGRRQTLDALVNISFV